jgi:hypothetical protein
MSKSNKECDYIYLKLDMWQRGYYKVNKKESILLVDGIVMIY